MCSLAPMNRVQSLDTLRYTHPHGLIHDILIGAYLSEIYTHKNTTLILPPSIHSGRNKPLQPNNYSVKVLL